MARLTIILSVLTALGVLLGGFKMLISEVRAMRERKRLTGKWLLVLALCLVPSLAGAVCGGSSPNWTAASAGRTDVNDCVAAIARGTGMSVDTITVPSGSATWSSGITLTKGVKLHGAGIGSTTITLSGASTKFFTLSPDATARANDEFFEVTGFTVDANNSANTFFAVTGTDATATKAFTQWHIGNNEFKNATTSTFSFTLSGQAWGVVAGNTFDRINELYQYLGNDTVAQSGCDVPADVLNSAYFPAVYGSSEQFVFEDNIIKFSSSFSGSDPGWSETGHGSRQLIRYNHYNYQNTTSGGGSDWFDTHGQQGYNPTCQGGVSSTIISEIYGNTAINSIKFRSLNHRGMWGLHFNNILSGSGAGEIHMTQYDWGCQSAAYTDPSGKPNGEINNTYIWNNTLNGARLDAQVQTPSGSGSGALNHTCPPVENTTFWNQASNSINASPCTTSTCTAGIGRATSAPTGTCTTGTAFWVASTASPVTSTAANGILDDTAKSVIQNGHLYQCQSINTWVDLGTPYIYPHPLRGLGGGSSPSTAIWPMLTGATRWLELAGLVAGAFHARRLILSGFLLIAAIGMASYSGIGHLMKSALTYTKQTTMTLATKAAQKYVDVTRKDV